jgi:hypothetical protein
MEHRDIFKSRDYPGKFGTVGNYKSVINVFITSEEHKDQQRIRKKMFQDIQQSGNQHQ